MRLLYCLLAVAAVFSSPRALASGRYVWVVGGAYSNVYHPSACVRVRRHRARAEKMLLDDALDLGLRRHTDCRPAGI